MTDLRDFTERERNIYLAKLSEQAECYDDMITYMKAIIAAALAESTPADRELTIEERNLLSVAYKNVIGVRRQSWRIISSVEGKGAQDDKKLLGQIQEYRNRVEAELEKTCDDILELLDEKLIPNAPSVEGKVFYYKMKGDYCRYQCEFRTPPSPTTAITTVPHDTPLNPRAASSASSAREAYASASSAASELLSTNPIRLGLALNYSVYYYEIAKDGQEACRLARQAFDDAMKDLDSLGEDSYKDSTLIMQLLRDNLTLWSEQDGNGVNGKGKNDKKAGEEEEVEVEKETNQPPVESVPDAPATEAA